MKKLSRLLPALVAGAILSYSYNQVIWWLAILAIAIYLRQLRVAQMSIRIQVTAVFFLTYWASVISWIKVLGNLPWLLLTLVCTLPLLLVALVNVNPRKLSGAIILASSWVVAEYIHAEFPWGGFPWGLVAHTQTNGPFMVLAEYGGQYFTSFGVVLVAAIVSNFGQFRAWIQAGVVAGVVVFLHFALPSLQSNEQVSVAVIQGSVPRSGFDFETQRRAVLSNHLSATRDYLQQSGRHADLVIWPENAVDNDPINTTYVRMRVDEISKDLATPLLVGGLVAADFGLNEAASEYNAGILWQGGKPGVMYAKHQLVPFGEFIPTGSFLRGFIEKQLPYLPRMIPGSTDGIFTLSNGTKFGDLICFEIANENYARQRVLAGAQFLTVQTNNATYENTSQPDQQLNITRFRAIENHRPIAVAATTGNTVIIKQDGKLLAALEPKIRGYAVADFELQNGTQYVHRWNTNVFVWICVGFVLFGLRKVQRR